jgi:2-dehydro-3-deoxyphosphogluconate aldolase/(4S)-4-hydroxy-2-oxoglutarate aldolase
MTVPDAPAVIRAVILHYGYKILAGAGTVSTTAEAEACLGAGAEFLVSPGLSLPVKRMAQARGKLAIPGVLTPTEVMTAQNEGAKLVKIFPCGSVGGPKYLKALRAPFPHLAMIPTGGVNISNASEYMSAGAFALGVGGDLVDTTAWQEGNTQKIVDAARALVNAVRAVRFS